MKRRTTKTEAAVAAVLLIGLTFSLTSYAATEEEQDQACRGDAFHFCSSEIPNREKIEACMKQHYDELSSPCKAMFGKKPKGQ
jgi:hypothetical protein